MLILGIGSMIECDGINDGDLRFTHILKWQDFWRRLSVLLLLFSFCSSSPSSSSSSSTVEYFSEGLYVVLTSSENKGRIVIWGLKYHSSGTVISQQYIPPMSEPPTYSSRVKPRLTTKGRERANHVKDINWGGKPRKVNDSWRPGATLVFNYFTNASPFYSGHLSNAIIALDSLFPI